MPFAPSPITATESPAATARPADGLHGARERLDERAVLEGEGVRKPEACPSRRRPPRRGRTPRARRGGGASSSIGAHDVLPGRQKRHAPQAAWWCTTTRSPGRNGSTKPRPRRRLPPARDRGRPAPSRRRTRRRIASADPHGLHRDEDLAPADRRDVARDDRDVVERSARGRRASSSRDHSDLQVGSVPGEREPASHSKSDRRAETISRAGTAPLARRARATSTSRGV